MGRVILHLDMDAFYASVEQRDRPELRGKPVVVGADPRGGRGRGVVCTASYEARAHGIRSAMPISQAYRLAPHAAFVAPDFHRYHEASRKVMDLLEQYGDAVEVLGMDEAYVDATSLCLGEDGAIDWTRAANLARSLQAAVRRATRLSCSVGIAGTKSAAKIATDLRKPHGVTCIPPEQAARILAPLPVGRLHGCGPKTAAALAELGIRTIADLAATPPAMLTQHFGSQGAWLLDVANGRDARTVDGTGWERKSRGNESTFLEDARNAADVVARAQDLLDELLEDQAESGSLFATLTVKIRYHGFVTLTRSQTSSLPLDAKASICRDAAATTLRALLDPLLDGRPVRLVGVRLSGFQPPTGQAFLSKFGVAWAGASGPINPRPPRRPAFRGFDPGGLRWTTLDATPANRN